MKIIFVTQMLCICITLAKTIYNPFNSTNPAQLLSTQATVIYTRRERDTSHIEVNPAGGSSHPPRPEWWALEQIWPARAQIYQGISISADDIYRAINVYENGFENDCFDAWPICDDGADINKISTETINCAAFNLVIKSAGTQIPPKPWFWPDEEIWPPRARVYEKIYITEDDIYRAVNAYEAGGPPKYDEWPICRGIRCETVSCAAFNLVFDIVVPQYQPWFWFWPDEEIWPPRARLYNGLNITAYDIYRAINVYDTGEWPISRDCEWPITRSRCEAVSCDAFNLVLDIFVPHKQPVYWPREEIWPPKARVFKGINITAYDIHRAVHDLEKSVFISCAAFNRGPDTDTTRCAARNLLVEEYGARVGSFGGGFGNGGGAIQPSPRPCGACRLRILSGKCVWSRSVCSFRGRCRRRGTRARPSRCRG